MDQITTSNTDSQIKTLKKILTIAGSDCSGAAGIQADIRIANNLGCYISTCITSVTAQNSFQVKNIIILPEEFIIEQLDMIMEDIGADAIKIGMIGSHDIANLLSDIFKQDRYKNLPIILDPVIKASSGNNLSANEVTDVIKSQLIKQVTMITPNLSEASLITGLEILNKNDMIKAGEKMLEMGAKFVLIKGGHLNGDKICDILFSDNQKLKSPIIFSKNKIETNNLRGTGCSLATSIACYLTKTDNDIMLAVEKAIDYINKLILDSRNLSIGKTKGAILPQSKS